MMTQNWGYLITQSCSGDVCFLLCVLECSQALWCRYVQPKDQFCAPPVLCTTCCEICLLQLMNNHLIMLMYYILAHDVLLLAAKGVVAVQVAFTKFMEARLWWL